MSPMEPVVDVIEVAVLSRYVVQLVFEDGSVRVLDLEPLLIGPAFEGIRSDYELFKGVAVDSEAGTIVWPSGADLSPRTLYAESKPAVPASAERSSG